MMMPILDIGECWLFIDDDAVKQQKFYEVLLVPVIYRISHFLAFRWRTNLGRIWSTLGTTMAQHLFSPSFFWKTSLTFAPINTWHRIRLGLAASASVWGVAGGFWAIGGGFWGTGRAFGIGIGSDFGTFGMVVTGTGRDAELFFPTHLPAMLKPVHV